MYAAACGQPTSIVRHAQSERCPSNRREHIERQKLQDNLQSWSEGQEGPEGGGQEEASWSEPTLFLKPATATRAARLSVPGTMDDLLSSDVQEVPSTQPLQLQPCALTAQHSLQTTARPHLAKANRRAHSSHVLSMAHEWEQPRAGEVKEGVVFMQLSEK